MLQVGSEMLLSTHLYPDHRLGAETLIATLRNSLTPHSHHPYWTREQGWRGPWHSQKQQPPKEVLPFLGLEHRPLSTQMQSLPPLSTTSAASLLGPSEHLHLPRKIEMLSLNI